MATSTQGESDATSVKTYPSVQKTYPNEPVGQFTSMTSSYAESMPSTGDFEAAYDIWLNKLPRKSCSGSTTTGRPRPGPSREPSPSAASPPVTTR